MQHQASQLSIFRTQLNSMSEDIKTTQDMLRECGVPFPIRLLCETRSEFVPRGCDGIEIHHNDCLVWDTIESGNQCDWALLYEETEQEGGIASEGCLFYDIPPNLELPQKTIVKKRLIETSVEIRLKMYKHLEKLINKVCKDLRLDEFQITQKNLQFALEKLLPK